MPRKQTKVRVQESKIGQYGITLPELIAKEWLGVNKGDRVEFKPWKGKIVIEKVVEKK